MRREADIRRERNRFVSVTHRGAAARAKMGRLPPCSTVYRSMGDRFDRTHTDGDVDFRHAAHLTFCRIAVSLAYPVGFVKRKSKNIRETFGKVPRFCYFSPDGAAVCPNVLRRRQKPQDTATQIQPLQEHMKGLPEPEFHRKPPAVYTEIRCTAGSV